jgi:hypothetical protein
MRFPRPYQVLITLFVTIVLMDAANLTTPHDHVKNLHDGSRLQMLRLFPQCSYSGAKALRKFVKKSLRERQEALECIIQENTKNVNDMISGIISSARFETTKTTLMKDNGKYFHAILGINDKQNVLPAEIGRDILYFTIL